MRYARDERFKIYGNGDLYDTLEDVLEKKVIENGSGNRQAERARKKLQEALDSFPSTGAMIDYDKVQGSTAEVVN